jgi:hypothetical protein
MRFLICGLQRYAHFWLIQTLHNLFIDYAYNPLQIRWKKIV